MLLLPPSESKSEAGTSAPANWLSHLSFKGLLPTRERVVRELIDVSGRADAAKLLGLTQKTSAALAANLNLRQPILAPAFERYTGVLFDALNDRGLKGSATQDQSLQPSEIKQRDIFIQSALLGLVGLQDRIPNYRLTAGIAAGTINLKIWDEVHRPIFRSHSGFVVDARSKSYAQLAPIPDGVSHLTVEVVAEDSAGIRTALNHFNKKAKGLFARQWALSNNVIETEAQLIELAEQAGLRAEIADSTLLLIT